MFKLHEHLVADTTVIVEFPLCQVLLMNDATYPWLILVPRENDVTEIIDLSVKDRQQLMEEISRVSEVLKEMLNPDKLNVAALGNMVPQLHVHVIARFKDDPTWPNPVWGVMEAVPYSEAALEEVVQKLKNALD